MHIQHSKMILKGMLAQKCRHEHTTVNLLTESFFHAFLKNEKKNQKFEKKKKKIWWEYLFFLKCFSNPTFEIRLTGEQHS